jgi:hypothetical protein
MHGLHKAGRQRVALRLRCFACGATGLAGSTGAKLAVASALEGGPSWAQPSLGTTASIHGASGKCGS